MFVTTHRSSLINKNFINNLEEAHNVLKHIQSLYEKKFTTYPRVDTTFLSDDIYPKIPNIMSALGRSDSYNQYIGKLNINKLPNNIKEGKLEIINSDDISECLATISEGKYHQLKRMFISLCLMI